jgi:lysine 2,3-aminomutase
MLLDTVARTPAESNGLDRSKFTAEHLKSQFPELFDAAREAPDLDTARRRMAELVGRHHFEAYDGSRGYGASALIRIRDCAQALRSMLTRRSEDLAGFSVAQALYDIARGSRRPDLTPGFYADLLYTLLGLRGLRPSGQPVDAAIAPSPRSGRQAAIERSDQLDLLWQRAEENLRRYCDGLDPEVVQARAERRERVLAALGGTAHDWHDWRWHVRHVIRDADVLGRIVRLSDQEREGIRQAKADHIPFGVTPYYASLMDEEASDRDRAVRFQVIPSTEYVRATSASRERDPSGLDFMKEGDTSPVDLVTRRYPSICILKPVHTCPQICVYCQRNWEIGEAMDAKAIEGQDKLAAALDWIAAHPAIQEVLVTGGDPFILSNVLIEYILNRLSEMPSIRRIRIGTRTPATLPMRITEKLAALVARHQERGRREVAVVTHFEHPYEVTPEVITAVARLRKREISVYNQQVFTFFVSRLFESVALRRVLRLAGIDPYYTFNMKGKDEMRDYCVPIARLLQEQREESRLLPGLTRTDEPVYNLPGQGKNHLRARQHRDLLAVLPSGARVYEFHPWEKNVRSHIRTYVGEDVPILAYLERLVAIGEDVGEYETIWYYF